MGEAFLAYQVGRSLQGAKLYSPDPIPENLFEVLNRPMAFNIIRDRTSMI